LALRDARLRDKVQSATRSALMSMVEFAIAEDVAALLISGDLFDGAQRSAKSAAFLATQFDRLNNSGIRVFYIKGNHDAENPISGEITYSENVHVFGGRAEKVQLAGCDIWIHGVSFSAKHAPQSLLPKYKDPTPDAINIAMMHTSLAGSATHDNYAPCTVAQLCAMGFDYWALGHIHKRQLHSDSPWVVMPGMPQGRDMGETGSKSATLISIENNRISIQSIPTSAIEFIDHVIDITNCNDEADIRELMRQQCTALVGSLDSEDGIVRITLIGQTLLRWQLLRDAQLWSETARQIVEDTGRLWLHEFRLSLENNSNQAVNSGHAVAELEVLMQEICEDEEFMEDALLDLDTVVAQLPSNHRADMLPLEESRRKLVGEMTTQGIQKMLALMKSQA